MRENTSEVALNHLLRRLEDKSATIGIIGMGYVGLPLMLRFSEAGFRVIGFDSDAEKVAKLNRGESYIKHIHAAGISRARASRFEASSDYSRCRDADAIIIAVPTPLDRHREPDLSFVIGSIDAVVPYLRWGQIVSLESTTYPGTTDEELQPRIQAANLEIGKDIFLVFSPEREDPGNANFSTGNIPKICGGATSNCLKAGVALYSYAVEKVVPVSSTRAAEMTKLLENIHRAVNIGLVNEMKIIADRMDIDIHEVIRAAATKPFGFVPYYPGPGLGGHCIPIDPFYLTWKAKEFGVHTRFIELAGEVNSAMPEWVIGKVGDALNSRKKALNGSRVLVLGVAYKKNVDDSRETPSAELIKLLEEKGANVDFSDPHVSVFPAMRKYKFDMRSVELTQETLSSYDCVLLATDHDAFDYNLIKKCAALIVDTRGIYSESSTNIVKA